METKSSHKTKDHIAIVGGGPAGLSTAFHLIQEEGWNEKYDITVYQAGWRLGGKAATGRDENHGCRIEEHGLHGLCRFYFNTWIMMARVFKDLGEDNRKKLATPEIDKAFLPSSLTYSVSSSDGRFLPKVGQNLTMPGKPWDNPESPKVDWKTVLENLQKVLRLRENLDSKDALKGKDVMDSFSNPSLATYVQLKVKTHFLLRRIEKIDVEMQKAFAKSDFPDSDEELLKELRKAQAENHILITKHEDLDKGHSRGLVIIDILLAMYIGLLEGGLVENEVDIIDHLTADAWLAHYGATRYTLNSHVFASLPNILFSAPDGDGNQYPDLSAAGWLNWMLRGMLGKGHYYFFMGAGTGESVVLPLYLYLKERGVKFKFFHKLRDTTVNQEKKVISQLVFERQATAKSGAYCPLVDVELTIEGKNRICSVWPNEPKWGDLEHGDENKGVDFEAWAGKAPKGSMITLDRNTDFTHVVIAFPPTLIPKVGLNKVSLWETLHEKTDTTATQAAQVWLTKSTEELGWTIPPKHSATARYVSVNFPHPLNAMAAFDDLIAYEKWGLDNPPRGLIYLCSQMQPIKGYTWHQNEMRVRNNLAASLRLSGNFLELGQLDVQKRHDSMAINFDFVYGNGQGLERLEAQYVRANTDPMEAYVQSPAGSAKARMYAWETGLENVVAAGDWTYTGFNIGAFESAITGGKLASFALAGGPPAKSIIGFDFLHPDAAAHLDRAVTQKIIPLL